MKSGFNFIISVLLKVRSITRLKLAIVWDVRSSFFAENFTYSQDTSVADPGLWKGELRCLAHCHVAPHI